MTSSLKAVLTSTAVFCAVGCSTGPSPANVPLIESSGAGMGSGTIAGSGATGAGSGTIAGSGAGSGTIAGSGAGTATGSNSGAASGSVSGAASGTAASGAASGTTASGAASGTAASGAASGGTAASGSTMPPLSFALDVYSDLGLCTTCLPCHGPPGLSGKLDLSTSDNAYASLLGDAGAGAPAAGPSCGGKTPAFTRVVPGNPTASLLYLKLNAKTTDAGAPCGSPMPKTGNALTPTDMNVISQWITGGAKP